MRIHHSKVVERTGNFLTAFLHNVALFAIGIAIVWSGGLEFWAMVQAGEPHLKDILLLFIYLELLAMVGVYFRTHRLPVRYLVYIAITALTRVLVVDVKLMDSWELMAYAGAILVLTVAVLILKYGSKKYPSIPPTESD